MIKEPEYIFDSQAFLEKCFPPQGELPNANVVLLFEVITPFLVDAYRAGQQGKRLTKLFPFIIESAPAAGTAETHSSPEATNLYDNNTTKGATAQEVTRE